MVYLAIMMSMIVKKKNSRKDRELDVLLGLVSLYLKQGSPVGSNTLRDNGFSHLSSATIRNYFAKLETEGYLLQQHASGGRIPTDSAFRYFAKLNVEKPEISKEDDQFLKELLTKEQREIAVYLQEAASALSDLSGCVAFIAAPRFDQDFIVNVQITGIDSTRALCIILTDFGMIHTEVLYLPKQIEDFSLERIQKYFHYRLTNLNKPEMAQEEEEFAKRAYNEVVLRHFVHYTNIYKEDLYKSGFSNLLHHNEFHDPSALSSALSLFENSFALRDILKKAYEEKSLSYWIGDDLRQYLPESTHCSLIAIPYYLHNNPVGAIGLLGPSRIAYKKVFGFLQKFSLYISESLTKNLYKYKLQYRQPKSHALSHQEEDRKEFNRIAHNKMIENRDE